jgi:hypothetical protein
LPFVGKGFSYVHCEFFDLIKFLNDNGNTYPLHFFMTICEPSLTFRINLWVLGIYFSTNLEVVGFYTSSSIERLVNYYQEWANVLFLIIFFSSPTWGSVSASIFTWLPIL